MSFALYDMEKLPETYRFPDAPKFEKGQDFQKWLVEYLKWQSDYLLWTEKTLAELALKINWLITKMSGTQTYAVSNVTTDRTYNANATTLDEIADVLGTLIADLRTKGLVL